MGSRPALRLYAHRPGVRAGPPTTTLGAVSPGRGGHARGRLIIGAHSEVAGTPPKLEGEVAGWGFRIGGHFEIPHAQDYRVVRRAFWIDKSA